MTIIKLNRKPWEFDDTHQLGPTGGFGSVFDCPNGVAIKRLNVDASVAKRELSLSDILAGQRFNHIVPVLDAGEDAESGKYFIVMPRCSMSLLDHLRANGGTLPCSEVWQILKDVLNGLHEAGQIIHRDLKPGNILRHEGSWKIADFGIAKFVEDTTSLETLRNCLTAAYAAPEQWLTVRATKATDLYSLACIAFQLLTGELPFPGGDLADWRHAHLNTEPTQFPTEVPPKVRSVLTLLLRKQPDTRPSLDRVMNVINAMEADLETGVDLRRLATIDAEISAKKVADEAAQRQHEEMAVRNKAIASFGNADILRLKSELFRPIVESATNAMVVEWAIALGHAQIEIAPPATVHRVPIRLGQWAIYAATAVGVRQGQAYAWSASLWYGNYGSSELRWWQVSFMRNPDGINPQLFTRHTAAKHEPFALNPTSEEAQAVFHTQRAQFKVAENPRPIDGEDFDDFKNEWLQRFQAATGRDSIRPAMLPL